MAKKRSSRKPLTGRVALVAGATRGAGRGIARALGEAGATVYCTGRSVKGKPSPYKRPETIDETAAMIKATGGSAIALRVDHTNEAGVRALFRRILRAHKRIDIVVDSVAGEDPLMGSYGQLWQADLKAADAIFRQGLTSRIITAKHAALAMMPAKRGHIVEVTENDVMGGGENPMCPSSGPRSSRRMASRSWRSPRGFCVRNRWCSTSASPKTTGARLARKIRTSCSRNRRCSWDGDRTGMLFGSWELGRDYGLSDYDGRRPDWGRHKINFSVLPPAWIDLFRRGTDLEIKWLTRLAARTRRFRTKIPS
jgi:hypothetical protein